MLFDEGGSVLLIRFVVPREDGEFVFWALPGGEIEAGETEAEAAVRELEEELGIAVTVQGPGVSGCECVFCIRVRCRTMWIFCFGRSAGERSPG